MRRVTLGLAACAAVAALAVATVVALHGNRSASSASGGVLAASHTPLLSHCGEPLTGGPLIAPANGDLSARADLARLCAFGPVRWYPPRDELTSDVGSLVRAFDGAPKDTGSLCPGNPFAISYTLTFGYPDGEYVRLLGPNGTCGAVSVAGSAGPGRYVGQKLLALFSRALMRQRASQAPPAALSTRTPVCPAPTLFAGLDQTALTRPDLHLVRAVLCHYSGSRRGHPAEVVRRTMSPIQLARFNAAVSQRGHWGETAASSRCSVERDSGRCPSTDIYGVNSWGDVLDFSEVPDAQLPDSVGFGPTVFVWALHEFGWVATSSFLRAVGVGR